MCFSLTYVRPQTHPSRSRAPDRPAPPGAAASIAQIEFSAFRRAAAAPRPCNSFLRRHLSGEAPRSARLRGSLALALDTVQTSNYPTVLDSARSQNAQHMHNDPSHLCAFSSPHTANSLAAQRSALSAPRIVQ